MSKKFHTIKVELLIKAPADKIWEAMVLDYGKISNFSPYIYASNYENGSLKGVVGAERKCNLNASGSRWVHERIAAIDEKNRILRNTTIAGAKFPIDMDNSQAFYQVKDNGNGTSTASYELQYRTKPAMMGTIAKKQFINTLSGTLVGLKHYLETGEIVNGTNGKYKSIKDKYPKAIVVAQR
jgi:Polyketide cyclase / dehydrase and lipid transport